MDPIAQSALISAAATVLSVGATAAAAIACFRMSRSASDKTVAAARDTHRATIDAAHADVRRTDLFPDPISHDLLLRGYQKRTSPPYYLQQSPNCQAPKIRKDGYLDA